jgi:hypothetical protein
MHAFVDQSAPDMTVWENVKYKDRTYVRITPSAQAKEQNQGLASLGVCYAPAGDSLVIALNEEVLKRAMDRQDARRAAATQPADEWAGAAPALAADPGATPRPWLGSQMALRLDAKGAAILAGISRGSYQQAMQQRAWNALPILNEWKRRYPDQDPVALHQKFWNVRLVCPGGGSYVWNEQYRTMESTVYGHPGQPKEGPAMPAALTGFASGDLGLTFENDGLRSRLEIERTEAP